MYKLIKKSTKDKPLYMSILTVEGQDAEHKNKPGKSNYKLIARKDSIIKEVYKVLPKKSPVSWHRSASKSVQWHAFVFW